MVENLHDFLKIIEEKSMGFSRDLSGLNAEEQFEVLKNSCSHLYPEDKILEKLKNSKKTRKPLTVKFGVDPTGTDLHLGHAVPLTLLNKLQRMGHKIIFLVGDFTATIGDPSGKGDIKAHLSRKEIDNNLKDYKKQASKFINFSKTDIVYNTHWLNDLRFPEIIDIFKRIDLAFSLDRPDFKGKIKNNISMTHAQLIYPIIMGFDSIVLNPDIEVGGEDQLDNFEMCRHMMGIKNQEPECIALTGIIQGIDGNGEKMSKSKDNYIRITEEPMKIFEKIYALPNRLIPSYFMWLTEIDEETVHKLEGYIESDEIDGTALKTILAKFIVARLYGKEESIKTYNNYMVETFKNTVTKDVRVTKGSIINICDMLSAATEYNYEQICRFKHNAGIGVYNTDGSFVEYLSGESKDINSIPLDVFYIRISDKIILRAMKK